MMWVLISLGVAAWASVAHGGVIFVHANLTTGANNGSSWANAHQGRTGLQAALAAAEPGDAVWVAHGVYAPAPANGAVTISFSLETGVRVLGGFVGNEVSEAQRDPSQNTTTLTGDLNNDDVPGSDFLNVQDNAHHVVRSAGPSGSGELDGFTVQGGRIDGLPEPTVLGGLGVFVEGGSPRIANCVIRRNIYAFEGAGALVVGGAPTFEGCLFTGNHAGRGGQMLVRGNADLTIRRCSFIDPAYREGGSFGAGLCVGPDDADPAGGPTVTIEDCFFSIQPIGLSAQSGTGMFIEAGSVFMRRTTFDRCQSAGSGGALRLDGGRVVADACVFSRCEGQSDGGSAILAAIFPPTPPGDERLLVANSVFMGNGRLGGGTTVATTWTSSRFVNCTFFDNGSTTSIHRQLSILGVSASTAIENCILWNNRSVDGNPNLEAFFGGSFSVKHSCIEGWAGDFPSVGTFSADPRFVNAPGIDGVTGTPDDDLRLLPLSPCVDSGNNTLVPVGLAADVAGSPRFRDETSVPDLGFGGPPVVDIGAHERVPTCPTDLNGDGANNTTDLVAFLGAFGQTVVPFSGPDLNGDSAVNTADLVLFLGAFGVPCG